MKTFYKVVTDTSSVILMIIGILANVATEGYNQPADLLDFATTD